MIEFAPIAAEIRASSAVPSCMGGWCRHRNACALHLRDDRRHPADRLCARGEERPVSVLPEAFAEPKEMPP